MKFLLIAFALVGIAAAALPDSATQGPNPQDIATPEPEYIDIDLPESAPAPKPAPVPAPKIFAPAPKVFAAAPRVFSAAPAPLPRPVQFVQQSAPVQHVQQASYTVPLVQQYHAQQQLAGHSHGPNGYQYRRPVFLRRVIRYRY